MDPATLTAVCGFVSTALAAVNASDRVLSYWRLVQAGLPVAVSLAEDGYRLLFDRIMPVVQMIRENRNPTQEEWDALDNHVISLLARLQQESEK